jgi:hypothetical protein
MVRRGYLLFGAQAFVAQWLQSFKQFPPRQKPASFNLDEVIQKQSPPGNVTLVAIDCRTNKNCADYNFTNPYS